MNDHPLGTLIDPPAPFPAAGLTADPTDVTYGDQILDLDGLLSGNVPLAEKTARICIRPDLEGRLDELDAELTLLVDERGTPYDDTGEDALFDGGGRTASIVAQEHLAVRREMAAAMRSVRVRAMPEDKWRVFRDLHATAFADGANGVPADPEVYEELIVLCAVAPRFTRETLVGFRSKVGVPAVDKVATAAFLVNTTSGVSVPKSLRASAVLRRLMRSSS